MKKEDVGSKTIYEGGHSCRNSLTFLAVKSLKLPHLPLLFMNYWNTSHNITIVCLPLSTFRDTPLHQAGKKSSWRFDEYMYTEIYSDLGIWHAT